jgi:2-dehydropantoate 2-reductase
MGSRGFTHSCSSISEGYQYTNSRQEHIAMKFLIIGAGAVGGYFGGRLLESGADVTFLLRPKRAALLEKNGFSLQSPYGDYSSSTFSHCQTIDTHYDVILVSCKAYDLENAIESFAPAVGPNTMIIPLLNGMQHVDILSQRFGAQHVLGGLCEISATLGEAGQILHLNQIQKVTFGEMDGSLSARVQAVNTILQKANFVTTLSENIKTEMWEKWIFIATLASITCLMRANIGTIIAAGGQEMILSLFQECIAIARQNGISPREDVLARYQKVITEEGSAMTSSMYRDLVQGYAIEAETVQGDLLRRGKTEALSVLNIAYVGLRAYMTGR